MGIGVSDMVAQINDIGSTVKGLVPFPGSNWRRSRRGTHESGDQTNYDVTLTLEGAIVPDKYDVVSYQIIENQVTAALRKAMPSESGVVMAVDVYDANGQVKADVILYSTVDAKTQVLSSLEDALPQFKPIVDEQPEYSVPESGYLSQLG